MCALAWGSVELAVGLGLLAAASTGAGGLAGALLGGRVGPKLLDAGLGFSSGVMTVASFTSLLLPAVELSGGPWLPLAGFLLGAAVVASVHRLVPHEHPLLEKYEGPAWGRKLRAAWLVSLAIVIHNLPEGLAIGAASAVSRDLGLATGLAIAAQDAPEGLAVALPVLAASGDAGRAALLALLSGLTEAVTAALAAAVGGAASWLLPLVLGFGAGAMMYVVSHEALPESHRSGYESEATVGFFAGFVLMFLLDTLL